MQTNQDRLPYFDFLLKKLSEDDDIIAKSFGRHVHWGYWENPRKAVLTPDGFALAVEELSRQICLSALLENGMAVLDVGCGFGGTIAHINENFQGMNLVGLNLDDRQLDRARELIRPSSGNKLEFKQGNACALPFSDESVDLVLAVECIFHFPDRKQFFEEALRVLKPGGTLALSDFIIHPLIKLFTNVRLPQILQQGFYGQCNFQYTLSNYRQLAREIGFKLKVELDINDNTLPTYDYLRRLSAKQRPDNPFAVIETASAEMLSRVGWLKYYIFSFAKPV